MQHQAVENFIARINEAFTDVQAAFILKALELAVEYGEESYMESVRMAELVAAQQGDYIVVTSLLLAPLRTSGALSHREVVSRFGKEIADLVESVYSRKPMRTDTEANRRADLRALLDSFSKDIRSSVLQTVARLSLLENSELPPEDLEALARESMEIYVPLAGRLGMGAVRVRLEDVCFRILEPEAYCSLEQEVAPIRMEDDACLALLIGGTRKLLTSNGIKATVQGRTKGLYSLFRKMKQAKLGLEAITDKIGLRIIVSSVPECYAVLGLLHTHYRPIPNCFKDYIGLPKVNGYQSLHTCVYPVPESSHKLVEFQIRTETMHTQAEFGVAAHWRYKSRSDAEEENLRQLSWVQDLSRTHENSADHVTFLQRLKEMAFRNEIVVFDEKGGRFLLSRGAAVGDYLRLLGRARDVSAIIKVNGEPASVGTALKDGDTVTFNG